MRKSLWIILSVLFVTVGAPNAHAQIIMQSGETVTGIDNLTIGTLGTYDVTFVVTDSPTITFTDYADTTTAADDIASALNSDATFPNTLNGETYSLVPYGLIGNNDYAGSIVTCNTQPVNPCPVGYGVDFGEALVGASDDFSEFTPVVTPEPRTSVLIVSGIGLIAFTLLIQKRRARGLLQRT